MRLSTPLLCLSLGLPALAHAQLIERDLDGYNLRLGTSPARSMAQGLVKPSAVGSFHGGLDLTHPSGWYIGQWSPSLGITPDSNLEIDSYLGFKHPFDKQLGYEIGVIQYSYPELIDSDSQEIYAGLTLLGSRFGAALSNAGDAQASTLFADLGGLPLLDIGVSVKFTNYQLDTPYEMADGGYVDHYTDWSLQLSRPWLGIDLDLIYSASSLSSEGCGAYAGHNSYCQSLVTLKAERAFF